jgi:hypothetical protein
MNAQRSTHKQTSWLSRIEQTVNRAADTLLEGAESFAKHVEATWNSLAHRVSRRHRHS